MEGIRALQILKDGSSDVQLAVLVCNPLETGGIKLAELTSITFF